MTHEPDDEIYSDEHLTPLMALLENGYNDEVRAYTGSIQTNQNAVLNFENIFHILNFEAMIDWTGTPSQEVSMLQVENTLEEMERFLEGMDCENYVTVTNHGNEATFEIGWLDRMAGPVVWDRWSRSIDDPVMAFADIGFMFDIKKYQCSPKQVEKTDPPLYRYHPERFKAYRDYAEPVSKFYRQKVEPSSGMLTVGQLNEIMLTMISELNRRSMAFPRKQKGSHPESSFVIEAEETLATAYGRFTQAGRQIMDFPPALIEMLARTDIDDIPLNSIRLPYASQYIHFGPQKDLELEPGWFVDGAYVEQRGVSGDVRFTLTAIPHDHSLSRQWYVFPEAEYTQDFVGDYRLMDLSTAINTMLSDRLDSLKVQQTRKGGDITASVQNELSMSGSSIPDGMRIKDITPKMAVIRNDITHRRFPTYRAALQLVVNALCYLAAYPDDIDTVWPEGTPTSLRKKAENGKGKEQTRAKSKLETLGYVPVHICGKRVAKQHSVHEIYSHQHGHKSTHWRRGHWRNQSYGPGRTLRKLIWVMPVVVGANNNEEPEAGHIYQVNPDGR